MSLRWYSVVVDSHDPIALGRWWAETLDFVVVYESADELAIIPTWMSPDPAADVDAFRRNPSGLVFVPVPEDKQVKNRLHIDLAPHSSQDRDAEIASLLARGATLADVGQGEVGWTVLRDPEGNEFCVLGSRDR